MLTNVDLTKEADGHLLILWFATFPCPRLKTPPARRSAMQTRLTTPRGLRTEVFDINRGR